MGKKKKSFQKARKISGGNEILFSTARKYWGKGVSTRTLRLKKTGEACTRASPELP